MVLGSEGARPASGCDRHAGVSHHAGSSSLRFSRRPYVQATLFRLALISPRCLRASWYGLPLCEGTLSNAQNISYVETINQSNNQSFVCSIKTSTNKSLQQKKFIRTRRAGLIRALMAAQLKLTRKQFTLPL